MSIDRCKNTANCRPLRRFFYGLINSILKISIMRPLIFTLILGITLFFSCTNSVENQSNNPAVAANSALPYGTITAITTITDLNCWVEQGQFLVAGVCNNESGEWQKIWLDMTPLDANGRRLKVNGDSSSVLPTFSDAVPPHGRTSFFAAWPLSAFSGTPDSCIVKGGSALPVSSGPILIAVKKSGVRVIVPQAPGDTATKEIAWQVNVTVENPLDIKAYHPRTELLIFGRDQRLWFATVLNPEDEQQKQYVKAEKDGPMEPHEKRDIGANVFYDNLPKALREQTIDHVDFYPFEARE